jgi:hypothetical protein
MLFSSLDIVVYPRKRRSFPWKRSLFPWNRSALPGISLFHIHVTPQSVFLRINKKYTHVFRLNVCILFDIYFTMEPFGRFDSTVAKDREPSLSSPDRIIPSDNSPRNLTGFKLVTQITFFPFRDSGV